MRVSALLNGSCSRRDWANISSVFEPGGLAFDLGRFEAGFVIIPIAGWVLSILVDVRLLRREVVRHDKLKNTKDNT